MRKVWHYIHGNNKDKLPVEGVHILVEVADMKNYLKDKASGKRVASFGTWVQNSFYKEGKFDVAPQQVVLAWKYFTPPESGKAMCCAKDFYESIIKDRGRLKKFISLIFGYDLGKRHHESKADDMCDRLVKAQEVFLSWRNTTI